ncbi:hypothetical protein [uncultured Paraglaciecola sp.]|uniref:hypothetical protein n=1 Tax=uncultured Paraglaciecola sp. TaxID=1765024 RepID=UPI0030D95AFB
MTYAKLGNVWRVLVTIGHLGLITLFCRLGILIWLQNMIANVDRVALTNCIAQTILAGIMSMAHLWPTTAN